jgi:hypothetical protein
VGRTDHFGRNGDPGRIRRRFRGCVEDGTVDKIRGHVVHMVTTDRQGRPVD